MGLQNATMVKWNRVALDPVAIFESIKERPSRSPHLIAWEMLFQAGRQHNAEVVMDKSLDSIHYADEMMSLFDDLLFLNVVRDPRSQINSINKAIIYDFDTLLNTLTWVKAYDAAKELRDKYPERVLTVRYEDFLHDSESVLRQICQFIGVEFFESMLDVAKSQEAQHMKPLSNLWETSTSAPITAHIDNFKKQLSQREIEIIETLAGHHMAYYGYERITTGQVDITPEMIDAARQQNQLKKQQAWKNLKKNDSRDYLLRKFRHDYIKMVKQRLVNKG